MYQAEAGIRDVAVTGVQTCALPVSSRIGLADMPQIPFLIQFRQLAQTILQFLPSRHSFARGLLRPLRNVITRGLALLPTRSEERSVGKECRYRTVASALRKRNKQHR